MKRGKVYLVTFYDDMFPVKVVAKDMPDAMHQGIELIRKEKRETNIRKITECTLVTFKEDCTNET